MKRLGSLTLGMALTVAAVAGAMAVCTWVIPATVSFLHGGWAEVVAIPVNDHIFPGTPTWLSPAAAEVVAGVNILAAVFGCIVAIVGVGRLWRRLVVDKRQWMTAEEFEEMLKRDPGF